MNTNTKNINNIMCKKWLNKIKKYFNVIKPFF